MNKSILWVILLWLPLISATELFQWQPIKITTADEGLLHWQRAEVYQDKHKSFVPEKILEVCKYKNKQLLHVFPQDLYKEDTADSSMMALFYAPGWNKSTKTPILLIHGAGDNPFRAWVHPYSFETPDQIPADKQGFMHRFSRAGYPVFALGFSHNQGCNYLQSEHIHNAIQVIKKKTGAEKVHIIAHSKGNCATSIYLCGGRKVDPEHFGFLSPFEQDVDIYIQLAAANKGIDLGFRYYTANLTTISNEAPAPVCFYRALIYGMWQNYYRHDIYRQNPGKSIAGNYFPGQSQLTYDLVGDGLDFSVFSYTPIDLNQTMKACYYGGNTLFVEAYGIRHAIKEGHYTIERINARGLHPSIRLINVYGTNPIMKEIDLGFIKIPIGVPDYPSDGLLYVHSSSHLKGLLSNNAQLLVQKDFHKNHLALAIHADVFEWLEKHIAENSR